MDTDMDKDMGMGMDIDIDTDTDKPLAFLIKWTNWAPDSYSRLFFNSISNSPRYSNSKFDWPLLIWLQVFLLFYSGQWKIATYVCGGQSKLACNT